MSNDWMRRNHPLRIVLLGGLCAFLVKQAGAQVSVDHVFPPVVSLGKTTIKAVGKFPSWPAKVACDRADVRLTADKDSGVLTVDVAKNASPGVAWVRFLDKTSSSNQIPLLITRASITLDTEPNNLAVQANELKLPTVVAGKLHKGGELDVYRVSLKQGQQLVASVMANRLLKSPMDAVLQLTDLSGNVLRQAEDERGLDPQLVYRAKRSADYLIRLFAFPSTPNSTIAFAGADTFGYALSVTTTGFVDHAQFDANGECRAFGWNLDRESIGQLRLAKTPFPNMQIAHGETELGWAWAHRDAQSEILPLGATAKSLPAIAQGHITKPDEKHEYRFAVKKGQSYRVTAVSKLDSFLMDANVSVIDPDDNKNIASNDDVTRGAYDAGITIKSKKDGNMIVRLTDFLGGFGPRHAYQLKIEQLLPTAKLTVESDHFTGTSTKPAEIKVKIERQNGYMHQLRFRVIGLPDSVKCEPVMSTANEKLITLTPIAAKDTSFQGQIQIIAIEAIQGNETGQEFAVGYELRPRLLVENFWLTISP